MQDRLVMLVADDVEVNRASMRMMFGDEYEVVEAADGQKTLEILHQRKIDVVILDVYMPILDGMGVLGQMKADSALRDIPVIAKTSIDENMELTMLEMGADDFIFSPSEPAIIKNRVRNIMQKYVYRQAMLQKKISEQQYYSSVRDKFIKGIAGELKRDVSIVEEICNMHGENGKLDIEQVEKIRKHVEHIGKRLDDVMNQTRLEEEERAVKSLPFQLRGVITDLARETTEICRKRDIRFVMGDCEILYDELVGDVRRLKQAWSRMLKNVYENTAPGGSISTGCRQRQIGKERLELEITVCGNINPDAEYPIVRSIVELLNGSVVVGDGSRCKSVMTLPFRIGHTPLKCGKKLMNMRVMLVDDNELSRRYHATCLMRLGIESDAAVNCAAALQTLREAYMSGQGYDICLVNWYMPNVSEFIREIRSIFPPERMAIACSTSEKEELQEKMKTVGVDYVMERPLQQEKLYRFLTDICRENEEKRKSE